MDLKYVCQQYFTYRYMYFLGFIRYNKTFTKGYFIYSPYTYLTLKSFPVEVKRGCYIPPSFSS
jgi:hypothetical protein